MTITDFKQIIPAKFANRRVLDRDIKGFVFDLDGTLSDSVPIVVATMQRTYLEFGRTDITDAEIKSRIGLPLAETGELHLGPGRGQEFVDAYMHNFDKNRYELHSFEDMPELLAMLRRRGGRIGLCTSKRQEATERDTQHIGVYPYLDDMVCCESTQKHKPDPEPALLAANQLALHPSQCIYVGDSKYDIRCGMAAGMLTCGVTWGACDLEQLADERPTFIAQTVGELRQILFSLP